LESEDKGKGISYGMPSFLPLLLTFSRRKKELIAARAGKVPNSIVAKECVWISQHVL